MARGRTKGVLARRVDGESSARVEDDLIVEEPLTIQLDGHVVATTMRTPGDDFELAAGLCLTEGYLTEIPVRRIRYCASESPLDTEFNVVTVETGGIAPIPTPRIGPVSSSCGWCGSDTVRDLSARLSRVSPAPFPVAQLVALPDLIRPHQSLFALTGAVHAAAAFDADGVIVVREDIGRHNAVDKVVGRLLLDSKLPAQGWGLWVSGRASYEIVQKAWAAGFGTVVAVSAPSALAVETAEAAGITLAGFIRGKKINLYS